MTSILINEKSPLLRDALIALLTPFYTLCFCEERKEECIYSAIESYQPDFLLSDGLFQTDSNVKFCSELRKKHPKVSILLYSMEYSCVSIRQLLNLGVKGLLLKTATQTEILSAICHLERNELYLHTPVRDVLIFSEPAPQIRKSIHEPLTKREQEVLNFIVEEFTTKEIADTLYIGSCTVETHRNNIISKLGVKNTAGLVREAIYLQLYQPKYKRA